LFIGLSSEGPLIKITISSEGSNPDRKIFYSIESLEAFLKRLKEAGETVELTNKLKEFLGLAP